MCIVYTNITSYIFSLLFTGKVKAVIVPFSFLRVVDIVIIKSYYYYYYPCHYCYYCAYTYNTAKQQDNDTPVHANEPTAENRPVLFQLPLHHFNFSDTVFGQVFLACADMMVVECIYMPLAPQSTSSPACI